MKQTFTQARIEAFVRAGAPEGVSRVALGDGSGLTLTLRGGSASWSLRYRMAGGGKQQAVAIGAWPGVGLKAAQEAAAAIRGDVAKGIDPAGRRREEKARVRSRVDHALDDYEANGVARLKKAKDALSSLRRGLAAHGAKELSELDRPLLVKIIRQVSAERGHGAGGDFRKHVVRFLNWGVNEGKLTANVMAGHRKDDLPESERQEREERLRALTPEETKAVWRTAEKLGGAFGLLVQVGLLTGLRRNELANLRWSWIGEDRIAIPRAYMKSKQPHDVPLTPMLAAIINRIPRRADCDLLLPSDRRETPVVMSGWSQMVAHLREESGVADASLHGLRRTFRTVLGELGVNEDVAERMLAHARKGLVGRYDKSSLFAARKDAALLFEGWLSRVLSGEAIATAGSAKVVALPTARKTG